MNRKPLSQLFESNRFLIVFAIFAAVLLYFIVAMTTNDTTTHTIYNVPVNLDSQSALLNSLSLEVIEGAEYTVNITVNGPRTIVGQLKSDSPQLATTVRFSEVTTPGTHTLPLVSDYGGNDLDFEITGYSPRTIQLRLDRLQSRTFDIKPITNGVSSAPGFIFESEEASPAKVTVSGPEAEIAKIASAEVSLELTGPLEATVAPTRPIVLRDIQGQVIDADENHLTLDVSEAQLIVTVFKETELPLSVDFTTRPRSFPIGELRQYLGMSQDSVNIRGPADVIDNLNEIRIGYIDLKELRPGSTFTFPLALQLQEISEQIRSNDNISSIDVYFDIPNWDSTRFNVRGIELVNLPTDWEVTLRTDHINDVEFAGIREALDSVSADEIVAEVDISDRVIEAPGQYNWAVKLSAPGKGLVWALGDHTVVVEFSEKN